MIKRGGFVWVARGVHFKCHRLHFLFSADDLLTLWRSSFSLLFRFNSLIIIIYFNFYRCLFRGVLVSSLSWFNLIQYAECHRAEPKFGTSRNQPQIYTLNKTWLAGFKTVVINADDVFLLLVAFKNKKFPKKEQANFSQVSTKCGKGVDPSPGWK